MRLGGTPAAPTATAPTSGTVAVGGGGPPTGIDKYAFRNTGYDVKPWLFGKAPVKKHPDLQATGERITAALKGGKGAGKSNMVVGIPRPDGGRFIIITFDETTRESIRKRFGAIEDQIEPIELYEVSRPAYEGEGANRKCVYKGYDKNDWTTAEAVLSQTVRILRRLEGEGNIDNLYLDHFGFFFEGPAAVLSQQEKNPIDDPKLGIVRWGRRTELAVDLLSRAWRIPSHFLGVSGYGERETLVSVEKDANNKTTINKGGIKHPTWFMKVQENFLLTLEVERVQFEEVVNGRRENRKEYQLFTEDSRIDRFPDNQTFDITGKTLASFWEKELPKRIA